MPVSTVSAAYHITPVVIKTFLVHYKRKGQKLKDWSYEIDATDDIFFDQGFHIVKAFLEMATHNTVESLQAFANTHIPSPWWASTAPVSIPLSCANDAADTIIKWFGPEELKVVVGGERWWQVRGLDGIDAEWITEREFLKDVPMPEDKKLSDTDADILKMDHLDPVMFYVHGGGYYFGSINTHRYQILRYARKFKGRAFAVNYRKSPQYPFPCAIQDVLAAYLYMINPPPGSLHSPVDPSKIVFAGDSAGGGLCINVLTILRDMDLPMPAGAVLISPWVDLTHSFPSVMQNINTDIIPPNGFMAKPSPLWPLVPRPKEGEGRVDLATSNPPPDPGHADTLKPTPERLAEQRRSAEQGKHEDDVSPSMVKDQKDMLQQSDTTENGSFSGSSKATETPRYGTNEPPKESPDADEKSKAADIERWEPKPPKVLMDDPNATPLQLQAQIQLYATNEQLTHPLCSPVLQGSLGGLCPLYIIAGSGEALRDEVIYLAHRAARPQDYPVREGALQDSQRQRENIERFKTPTKVHLQVFDEMCHVLTVFTYTAAAKYAYRSIAQFVRQVTTNPETPFPELQIPREPVPDGNTTEAVFDQAQQAKDMVQQPFEGLKPPALQGSAASSQSEVERFHLNADTILEETRKGNADRLPREGKESHLRQEITQDETPPSSPEAATKLPTDDLSLVSFIRERVDILGKVRLMEPAEEIPSLHLKSSEIGIIKEAPVRRWLDGQAKWDKLYKHSAQRAASKREQIREQAEALLRDARQQGLTLVNEHANDGVDTISRRPNSSGRRASMASIRSHAEIQSDRRWGPLDLEGERVPPSAICNRRDTQEALALLKKSIYYTAPRTHNAIPTFKRAQIVKAVLNPNDRFTRPPKQSVSEQQQSKQPMHGLRMWSGLVSYFMKHSSIDKLEQGKEKGKRKISHGTQHVNDAVRSRDKPRYESQRSP